MMDWWWTQPKKGYGDCIWWCQAGVGFPSIGPPGKNLYIQGVRWGCPCGRSWRVRGDCWSQESRLRAAVMNRWWGWLHPERFETAWWNRLRYRLIRDAQSPPDR